VLRFLFLKGCSIFIDLFMRIMRNTDLPCAILADDLTGAADAGLPFAARGYATNIWLAEGQGFVSAAIHVYDTASRSNSPEQAAAKVRSLCEILKASNCPLIFKKLDSTLLGNLAAEIEAVMEALGFELALIAPAFPAMGRTLVEGRLCLFGEPSDPPRFLPALLREQGASSVGQVGLDILKHGAEAIAESLSQLAAKGARLIVLDSDSQEDLRQIAQAAELLDSRTLLAGAGALAGEIAGTLPIASCSERAADEQSTESGCVLLVIGSANAVTERQLNHLLHLRPVVALEADSIIDLMALKGESYVLLRVKPGSRAEFFSGVISALLGHGLRGLVLSGGDTAEAVARCLNASGIRLGGEIVPGVPWGHIIGGTAMGLPIATKSGGFGADEALVEAVDFLYRYYSYSL
jgi:D-threonate/D-erythronate kinase